jgi:KipI family sensor histidine kinase inhibitor
VTVTFLPSGDTAIVIEFGTAIDRAVSEAVLRLGARIRDAGIAGILELVPTFRSLVVHYDPLRTTGAALIDAIKALPTTEAALAQQRRLWRVPVCYEGDLAPDLMSVAEATKLSPAEVVALHSGTQYHVYMIGFLPGFPYMGDLPERLVLPRRTDPRVRVPPGAVAIAMAMTAIYPLQSPGGWHLLGTTPIRLFDLAWPEPALFAPGDAVRFEPVDRATFDRVREAADRGDYSVPHERLGA